MNRIKDLISDNLYGKSSKLVENFSLDKNEMILAEEFDSICESIEKLTEGPLANIFGAIQQGYKTYAGNRFIQKADAQIAKNLRKDSKNINAAIGVLASSLSKRISRLGELGKELQGKIKEKNPEIADKIDHAINARILDASEFLNRVTAAKHKLAADTNTDPKKSVELAQKADELEQKADQRNQQQKEREAQINPVKDPDDEKSVDDIVTPDDDLTNLSSKIQNAGPETKDAIKKRIQDTLKNKGGQLLDNILKKVNVNESNELEEREYRGIINPTTIQQLLKNDKSKLSGFNSLSRAKQNLVARELEKAVLSDISDTPELQQLDTQDKPEISDTPDEQPDAATLDRSEVANKKLNSVKDMLMKAGHGAKSSGYANGIINFVVKDFNNTRNAQQTIQNLANDSKWGDILGDDAKSIGIQILDSVADINEESNERPIISEMRKRLRKTIL